MIASNKKNKSELKTDSGLPKNIDFDLDKEQSNTLVDIFTTAEYLKIIYNHQVSAGASLQLQQIRLLLDLHIVKIIS